MAIFRLNYVIIDGTLVAIYQNTNLIHSDIVPKLIKIHKYFENVWRSGSFGTKSDGERFVNFQGIFSFYGLKLILELTIK